jgi:hypothetical protein
LAVEERGVFGNLAETPTPVSGNRLYPLSPDEAREILMNKMRRGKNPEAALRGEIADAVKSLRDEICHRQMKSREAR